MRNQTAQKTVECGQIIRTLSRSSGRLRELAFKPGSLKFIAPRAVKYRGIGILLDDAIGITVGDPDKPGAAGCAKKVPSSFITEQEAVKSIRATANELETL